MNTSTLILLTLFLAHHAELIAASSWIDVPEGGVWENDFFAFTVRRSGDTNTTISVDYATTTNGTARPGVDFTPVSERLVFRPGEIFKNVVPLLNNSEMNAFDDYKSIELRLSSPSPEVTVLRASVRSIINDDEISADLDLSFDPKFGRSPGIAAAAALPDRRVLVSGNEIFLDDGQVSLLRLNPDGSFDRTFNSAPTRNLTISNIGVTSEEKIVIAGLEGESFFVKRLLSSGEADSTFKMRMGDPCIFLLQNDSNVVLWNAQSISRLKSDGTPDNSFDRNSSTAISSHLPTRDFVIREVQAQSNGQLFALLRNENSSTNLLIRLNSDGSRDPAFAPLPWLAQTCFPQDMFVLADGRVIVKASDATGPHFRVLNSDGTTDTSFKDPLLPNLGSVAGMGRAVAEFDGKIYFDDGVIFRTDLFGVLDSSFVVKANFTILDGGWGHGGCTRRLASLDGNGFLLLWGDGLSANNLLRPIVRVPFRSGAPNAFIFESNPPIAYDGRVVASENQVGMVEIGVRRAGRSSAAASLRYATTEGTARAGKNFVASSGILTFAPLETRKTISIPVLRDDQVRKNTFFFVTLSEPSIPAQLERQIRIDIFDADLSLSVRRLRRRRDGFADLEYSLAGTLPGTHVLERSNDLKSWGVSFSGGYSDAIQPLFIRIAPGENHGFFRAQSLDGFGNPKVQ